MVVFLIVLIAAAVVIFYLWCISPNRGRHEEMKTFEKQYIAHRGLFDNKGPAPENSLAAFTKAVEEGYGIELDVQMTTDGKLVVFHDFDLERMCGISNKKVTECSFEELRRLRLAGSDEKIPLLDEALEVIGGRVPLVVEIKPDGDWKGTCVKTAKRMDRYDGEYCIESFHPLVVRWFRKNRPDVIRGQLASDFFKTVPVLPFPEKLILTNLLLNGLSKPDFIAFDHHHTDAFSFSLCRRLYGVECYCWTIRSQAELENASKTYQVFIFDSFIPE